jgi:uncharacterized protein YbjQ (UPF0145 family)
VGLNCQEPGIGWQYNSEPEDHFRRGDPRAKALGANAVISVDFDSSELSNYMTEVLAYGTAVVVEKETAAASPVRLS